MGSLHFDVAHLLAGGLVLISFVMLYQVRLYALLNVFAAHAVVLSLSVAWQAYSQGTPDLYLTALIALLFKGIVIPLALHRMIARLGIHREIEKVVGIGPTMLAGMGLVALAMVVMLQVTPQVKRLTQPLKMLIGTIPIHKQPTIKRVMIIPMTIDQLMPSAMQTA